MSAKISNYDSNFSDSYLKVKFLPKFQGLIPQGKLFQKFLCSYFRVPSYIGGLNSISEHTSPPISLY